MPTDGRCRHLADWSAALGPRHGYAAAVRGRTRRASVWFRRVGSGVAPGAKTACSRRNLLSRRRIGLARGSEDPDNVVLLHAGGPCQRDSAGSRRLLITGPPRSREGLPRAYPTTWPQWTRKVRSAAANRIRRRVRKRVSARRAVRSGKDDSRKKRVCPCPAGQTRRINPAGRTKASVGPEGRTERSR